MDKHIESFEFIDIENIKLEPEYENELLEDPLLPRQADIEFIKRNLKEEPQVKLGQIKDEKIDNYQTEIGEHKYLINLRNLLVSSDCEEITSVLERTSKNGEQLIESDTFHRKNNEVISRFSSNTTVISGKDSYRVTDKLPAVEPNEDSKITDKNLKNKCPFAKTTGKSSVDASIKLNKDQNIEFACIDSITGSSSGKNEKTQLPEIEIKKKSCVLENSDCLVSITEHNRSKSLNIRNFKHTSDSHKKQTFSCKYCSFISTDINYLQIHTTIIHNRNKIKKCPLCPEVFGAVSSLNNHVKIKHSNYELFHCEDYEHYTDMKSDLKHNVTAVQSGVKPFQCFHCSRFFSRKGYLKNHITNVHLPIIKFELSCSYKLLSPMYIKNHLKTVHLKGTKFYCSECKFSTNVLPHLMDHYRIVHILKKVQYMCKYCQRLFTHKCRLVSHIQGVHFKLKHWKCTHCSYASFMKKGLKAHVLRKHTEGGKSRNFSCHLCSYKATERRTLDRHIKAIHTKNDNPFKCHLCDQTFNFKQHLNLHLNRDHLL